MMSFGNVFDRSSGYWNIIDMLLLLVVVIAVVVESICLLVHSAIHNLQFVQTT